VQSARLAWKASLKPDADATAGLAVGTLSRGAVCISETDAAVRTDNGSSETVADNVMLPAPANPATGGWDRRRQRRQR
jgi:hypothetical protein